MVATENRKVIEESDELGIAMLIAEAEDGTYQPVAPVSTIGEARDMVKTDMRARMSSLEDGGDPMCPARYLVWARGGRGEYATVAEIEAN